MKKRAVILWVLLPLLMGCKRSGEPQIIGTRQEETERSEQKERERDRDMADSGGLYEADFTTAQFWVTAKAPVTMPENEVIKETRGIKTNFSGDTFERVSRTLSDSLGMVWGEEGREDDKSGTLTFMTDEEAAYKIDYRTVTNPDSSQEPCSFIWCVNLGKGRNWGSTERVQTYDVDSREAEHKRQAAEELQAKTEQMLKDMGLSEYGLRRCWWRHETYSRKQEGVFFYQAVYTPSWSGLPFVSESSYFGHVNASGPYLQVTFKEDGSLEQFKLVDTCEEEPGQKESQLFLLPFASVAELFEQYVKDYEEHDAEGDGQRQKLQVTRVTMEYAWNGDGFVPVWSFYGRIDSGRETLLLSIRADDGQALSI